jgi:hypothetical protein
VKDKLQASIGRKHINAEKYTSKVIIIIIIIIITILLTNQVIVENWEV